MVNKNKKEILKQIHGKYFEAVGRRKTSVARVRIYEDAGEILVNDKPFGDYFKTEEQRKIAKDSLELLNIFKKNRVTAKINGGGIHSQAEALRHGIARALTKMDISLRKTLK